MNNTKTATLAVAAIFIAVTLVVGGTFASTSAFAYVKKGPQDNKRGARDNNGSGNGNGNTITVEKCKNRVPLRIDTCLNMRQLFVFDTYDIKT